MYFEKIPGKRLFLSPVSSGTEATELLLTYGFNVLNLHNIDLQVMGFNQNAIRCYEKAGFKQTGARRECFLINGKWWDEIQMDILATEFKSDSLKMLLPE